MTIRDFIAATLQEPLKKFRTPIQDAILEIMTQALEELHYNIKELPNILNINKHSRLDILDVMAESWGYNIPPSADLSEQIDIFSHIAYVNKIRGSIWSIEHCKDIYGGDLPDYIHIETPSYKIFRYSISPYSIDHVYQDAYRNRVGVYELYLRNYSGNIEEFKNFLYEELVASGSKIYLINNLTADIRSLPLSSSISISEESQTSNSYVVNINKNYLRDSDINTLESENRQIRVIDDINQSSGYVYPIDVYSTGLLPFSEIDIFNNPRIYTISDTIVLRSTSIDDSPCNTNNAVRAICSNPCSIEIIWGDIPDGDYHISYYRREYNSSTWDLIEDDVTISGGDFSLEIDLDTWDDYVYTGFKLETGNVTTPWTDSDQDEQRVYPDIFIKVSDSLGHSVYNNIEYLKTVSSYLNDSSILEIIDTNDSTIISSIQIKEDVSNVKLVISRGNLCYDYNYQRLRPGDKIYLELEDTIGVYYRKFVTDISNENTVLSINIYTGLDILRYEESFVYLPVHISLENPSILYSRTTVDLTDLVDITSYQYLIGDGKGVYLPITKPVDISSEGYSITEDAVYTFERVFDLIS